MKVKFYKKHRLFSVLPIIAILMTLNTVAQTPGLYIDSVLYTTASTVTVNIKSKSFGNIFGFAGSLTWDKASLQYSSYGSNSSLGTSNYLLNTTTALTQGVLTYGYGDATATHTLPDGTIVLSITFNVINNPVATYNNNVIAFSNTPTALGIDTADASFNTFSYAYPNIENHISGLVSFARPPVLSYSGGNVTDSVTNRPAGCTYQWTLDGSPVAGTSISSFNNPPTGNVCLTITYPNGNSISCVSSVLPIKLSSFNGKNVENKNLLTWSTSTEINTNNFEIERSINGKEFIKIGTVKAFGNSSTTQNYSFTDANFNKTTPSYYRLKANDNDGKYSYSTIIKISSNDKSSVGLYPNPTKNSVTVDCKAGKQIVITDYLGRVVYTNKTITSQLVNINVNQFARGIYTVQVLLQDGSIRNEKLIVE